MSENKLYVVLYSLIILVGAMFTVAAVMGVLSA